MNPAALGCLADRGEAERRWEPPSAASTCGSTYTHKAQSEAAGELPRISTFLKSGLDAEGGSASAACCVEAKARFEILV